MTPKTKTLLYILATLGVIAGLRAQTQVNYNFQVSKTPTFQRQQSAQALPDGTRQYFGEAGNLRAAAYYKDEEIRPGLCAGFAGPGELENLPPDFRNMAAPAVIVTPKALYFCVPDGGGQSFRLMRIEGVFTW